MAFLRRLWHSRSCTSRASARRSDYKTFTGVQIRPNNAEGGLLRVRAQAVRAKGLREWMTIRTDPVCRG